MIIDLKYLFDGSPSRVQFAVNGAWERARKFDLETTNLKTTNQGLIEETITNVLEHFSGDVALEVFFGPRQRSMLGFRYSSSLNATPQQFLTGLTRLALQSGGFDSYLDGLEILSDAWGIRAFDGEPQNAELGILDAWRSHRTLELWHEPTQKFLAFDPGFGQVPHLLENSVHHVLLEFAFGTTFPHWAGFVVSEQVPSKEPKMYRLDQQMLETIFTSFGFTLESDPQLTKSHAERSTIRP